MNYEDFYKDQQTLEKIMAEKMQNAQKSFKSITKNAEKGDLKNLAKDVALLKSLLDEAKELSMKMDGLAEGFATKDYFESGDFARQIIEYCRQYSVDVKGDFPTYELFPYKVRIDAENQDIYINRKKIQCARPLRFVQDIKLSREKYIRAQFNVNQFLNELAAAYDLAAIVKGRKNNNMVAEYELHLKDLYEYIAPTQRARREYDMNNYAFDLARLYSSDVERTKDNRKYEFGTSKSASKLIRILDQNGAEQFLGTVRFYKTDY